MKCSIFWDFDGVILDSMAVRDWGFEEIFKDFPRDRVAQLIKYHRLNGGLSRYVKIRYFYEEILAKEITEELVMQYALEFSRLMKKALINPKNLLEDSLTFIKENHQNYNFHIVSGSDQKELRFLCKELKIDKYFKSIHGSPTTKKQLVKNILEKYRYAKSSTCLIGDSVNDYEAAESNQIKFYGYNSPYLKSLNLEYIDDFRGLEPIFF